MFPRGQTTRVDLSPQTITSIDLMPPYRPPHLRNAPQRASDTPSSSSLPSRNAPPKQQAIPPPKQPISKLALEHLPSLSRSSTEADSALLQLDVQDAYRDLVLEKVIPRPPGHVCGGADA